MQGRQNKGGNQGCGLWDPWAKAALGVVCVCVCVRLPTTEAAEASD